MLIKKSNNWMINSDFELMILNRWEIQYIEKNHVLILPIEHIGNPFRLLIFLPPQIKWKYPHDGVLITSEKQGNIQKNIAKGLIFLNIPFEFNK